MLKQALQSARALYRRYPARINSYVAAGLVALASAVGLVLDAQSVGQVVAIVVPILIGGEATHKLVSPSR
jgi:hypothetical protein